MTKRVFCINPGATSTRIAVFQGETCEFTLNIKHENEQLEVFDGVQGQLDYRYGLIQAALEENGITLEAMDAIVGRGGALRPMEGGVFTINEAMLQDCRSAKYAEHPSNLGCQLAVRFAALFNIPSFVVDPPLIDEFEELARPSGLHGLNRISAFHALNEKAVAQFMAEKLGKPKAELNFVTAHLGSGISVTAQKHGRCVDNNFGSGGDGPFSPERCGRLPALRLLEAIAADTTLSAADWKKSFSKKSGVVSYVGSNDMIALEKSALSGDPYAKAILDGFAHFIAREIAAYATILDWQVDAIGITGAIARSGYVTAYLTRVLACIAPVLVYPGEFEMEALAAGGIRALEGKETAKTY